VVEYLEALAGWLMAITPRALKAVMLDRMLRFEMLKGLILLLGN
jgi:hypothetical protein